LNEKVDMVLAKGATPAEGKWNNNDLKFMIQWFKRNGNKSMPKNKYGLILRYRETHTRVVRTYPHEDAAAAPAATAAVAASQSTHDPNTFALAAAGNPAAAHAAPVTLVATYDPRTPADGTIVAAVAAASPSPSPRTLTLSHHLHLH
jgi:hypothetical protein